MAECLPAADQGQVLVFPVVIGGNSGIEPVIVKSQLIGEDIKILPLQLLHQSPNTFITQPDTDGHPPQIGKSQGIIQPWIIEIDVNVVLESRVGIHSARGIDECQLGSR